MSFTKDSFNVIGGSAEAKAISTFVGGLSCVFWLSFLPIPSFVPRPPVAILGVAAVIIALISKKFAKGGQCTAKRNLSGKVALVTGAATGIGIHTVQELARNGATVILSARGGSARLESAVKEASQGLSSSEASRIKAMELDLSSLDKVKSFAKEFSKQYSRLDLLINNAGIMLCPYALTTDGLESQMATNHFAHFLLTQQLLPLLKVAAKDGGEARVVNLSSLAHTMVKKMTYPKQNKKETYDPSQAYADSKLANIFFTTVFEKKYGSQGIHAYAVHPGFVATPLYKHLPGIAQSLASPFMYFTYKTPCEGAQTSLFCALSKDAVPGRYHSDAKVWRTGKNARDEAVAQAFWEESERITGVQY